MNKWCLRESLGLAASVKGSKKTFVLDKIAEDELT
jgi:hypothetical protein